MYMTNQTFRYNGSPITFQRGDSVMVNATEMAKPFGKLPKDWIKTKQAEELIASVSSNRNILPFELVHVVQGSPETGGGTWLHEDLALIFAQWLSPKFYLWCNARVKELLTTGVAINPCRLRRRKKPCRLKCRRTPPRWRLPRLYSLPTPPS